MRWTATDDDGSRWRREWSSATTEVTWTPLSGERASDDLTAELTENLATDDGRIRVSVMDLGAGQFADRSRLFTIASDDMGFSRSRFPAMTSNDPPCRPTAAAAPLLRHATATTVAPAVFMPRR